MWIYVFFDLPTETKQDVRAANKFRKMLLDDGFAMFQFSIYLRHCSSRENAKVHENRIKKNLPRHGKVGILTVTDKQFGMMNIFHGTKAETNPTGCKQLELF
jgi:CRISPR-associated protein Cas2